MMSLYVSIQDKRRTIELDTIAVGGVGIQPIHPNRAPNGEPATKRRKMTRKSRQIANSADVNEHIQIAITSTIICAVGIILLMLYCPWPTCPCVTIAHGTFISSTIQHSHEGYFGRYQYSIPEFNTTNCFRDDTSRMYQTGQLAEQYALYSDYVNFTTFYYDARIGRCYNIGEGRLIFPMIMLIIVVVVSGIVSVVHGCAAICKSREI